MPAGTQPRHRIVEPKLSVMEKRIAQLDVVILKLASFQQCTAIKRSDAHIEEAIPENELAR